MKINASENNKREFMKMIAWIELCGNIGHTCQWFKVGVDGDGSGRLNFEFDDKQEQDEFDKIKNELLKEYDETDEDLKEISFE